MNKENKEQAESNIHKRKKIGRMEDAWEEVTPYPYYAY